MTAADDPFAPPRPRPPGSVPYGVPYGLPVQPHQGQPHAAPGWTAAPGGWASGLVAPGPMLLHAARRGLTASAFLWLLLLAHLLFAGAGVAYAVAASRQDAGAAAQLAAADTGLGLVGLGLVTWLGLGTAAWALLGLWASWTARAAATAGNAPGRPRSSWAWWGLLVPGGTLSLLFLAYADAARYLCAGERTGGQGRGRGGGWRAEPLPPLLVAWWALHAAATALFLVGLAAMDGAYRTAAVTWLLCGAAGAASTACGALALRRLATAAEAAAR